MVINVGPSEFRGSAGSFFIPYDTGCRYTLEGASIPQRGMHHRESKCPLETQTGGIWTEKNEWMSSSATEPGSCQAVSRVLCLRLPRLLMLARNHVSLYNPDMPFCPVSPIPGGVGHLGLEGVGKLMSREL